MCNDTQPSFSPASFFPFLFFFILFIIWTLSEIEYTMSSTNEPGYEAELSDRKVIMRAAVGGRYRPTATAWQTRVFRFISHPMVKRLLSAVRV